MPLALAHAAAFLRDNWAVSAEAYISKIDLYMDKVPEGVEYPKAVFATFKEAIEEAERRAPGSAVALCLAAFYAPDDIPFELYQQPRHIYLGGLRPLLSGEEAASLRDVTQEESAFTDALSALSALSLISLNLSSRTFSIHRLVQASCRDLVRSKREKFVGAAVRAIGSATPENEFKNWSRLSRLATHTEEVSTYASPKLGDVLGMLLTRTGGYLIGRGEFDRAEVLHRRAASVAEKVFGKQHAMYAACLNNISIALCEMGRHVEAEQCLRESIAIDEKRLGAGSIEVDVRLNNLANILSITGRKMEAEHLYRRALAGKERELGPDHIDVATTLNNLANLLGQTGRPLEAREIHERVLKIDERTVGQNHPSTAATLRNLSRDIYLLGQVDEALATAKRSLNICQSTLGNNHPDTAKTKFVVMKLEDELAGGPRAETFFRE